MAGMEGGKGTGLPALLERRAAYRLPDRHPPRASFLSQLIAERQRADAPAPHGGAAPEADAALSAYAEAARRTVRRLPSGYRRSRTACANARRGR